MAKIINDGAVVAGSQDLTLSNGYTYATDDYKFDTSTKSVERTNSLDILTGRKVIQGGTTGSATLQFSAANTPIPTIGLTFTDADSNACYITQVGKTMTKAGESKIPISFMVAITNSVTVTTA
jgi:hypothetical protein